MIYIYNGRKYKNKLKIYYESLCTKINIKEEKFIFVALHYQPEETTCPSWALCKSKFDNREFGRITTR